MEINTILKLMQENKEIFEDEGIKQIMNQVLNHEVLMPIISFLQETYEKYHIQPHKAIAGLLVLAKRHEKEFLAMLKDGNNS